MASDTEPREGEAPPRARPDPAWWSSKAVAVTGGNGFLGRHTVRMLEELGADARVVRSSAHDLRDPAAARDAVSGAEVVLHLAANVGGIGYINANPGPVVTDNLRMGVNVFDAARDEGVAKLVVAGSVCAYPRGVPVPFREDSLWSGYPEAATAPYGVAKRTLMELSAAYRRQYELDSVVPLLTNLYGPEDNYDLENSHVVAAMVRKYVEAAERGDERVVLWGTGTPTREVLYVEDAARAMLLAAERYHSSEPVNVGTGIETSIKDLAAMVSDAVGYEGETVWDTARPDGVARRFLDVDRARERFGFEARVPLGEGLRRAVESFRRIEATQPA